MILNIWSELPDMYIIMAVMGSCFTGAKATSQAFFNLRTSISALVGGARMAFEVAADCFWDLLERVYREESEGRECVLCLRWR
jgi:hypothetical protein